MQLKQQNQDSSEQSTIDSDMSQYRSKTICRFWHLMIGGLQHSPLQRVAGSSRRAVLAGRGGDVFLPSSAVTTHCGAYVARDTTAGYPLEILDTCSKHCSCLIILVRTSINLKQYLIILGRTSKILKEYFIILVRTLKNLKPYLINLVRMPKTLKKYFIIVGQDVKRSTIISQCPYQENKYTTIYSILMFRLRRQIYSTGVSYYWTSNIRQ